MLIGFSGLPRSGKTTASGIVSSIVRRAGKTPFVMSFASPIKKMLLSMGVPHSNLYTSMYKDEAIGFLNGRTARELMQTLGTEWGRSMVCSDIWVRLSVYEADSYINNGDTVIYDDVRFVDEADAIRKRGGILIKVEKRGDVSNGHSSDSALRGYEFDEVVYNDGDKKDLEEKINDIISRIRSPLSPLS